MAIFVFSRRHGWWVVMFAGLASFTAGFGALSIFAVGWAAAIIPTFSETVLNVVVAALIAQFAMSLTHALLTRHRSRENKQLHLALDSMAQGLCMFDGSERLVACNSQYYKMYALTSADVTPGSTLSEVLVKRVAKGTFNRDPHQYRKDFLTAVAQGRTIEHEVKAMGGRLLLVKIIR